MCTDSPHFSVSVVHSVSGYVEFSSLVAVFQEIVVALAGLVQLFETQFVAIAAQMAEEEKQGAAHGHYLTLPAGGTTGAYVRALWL